MCTHTYSLTFYPRSLTHTHTQSPTHTLNNLSVVSFCVSSIFLYHFIELGCLGLIITLILQTIFELQVIDYYSSLMKTEVKF